MAQTSIPVDVLNPGQVFACVGFMEAAELICGSAAAGFDWSDRVRTRFVLRASGTANPFEAVLGFLGKATLKALAPHGSKNDTASWSVRTEVLPPGEPFPYPDPGSPATLPALLSAGAHGLLVDHWGDATVRDNVKFWAGAAGYPGVGLARDALDLVRPLPSWAAADPFSVSALQTSGFRFDWRRDYIPIDAGFSLNNNHPTSIHPRGYPLVELMAAIGLSHARPQRLGKLAYRYGIAGRAGADESEEAVLLPSLFVRAALGCAPLPFTTRVFQLALDWPGQEGQARSITSVTEETP